MRGPSSSHSAAALRIGKLARALMGQNIRDVLVAFDETGSLPTTHASQGSDMGIISGLLGFDAQDERLLSYQAEIKKAEINFRFEIGKFGDTHPNTYRLTVSNIHETHFLKAISTGGGMIEITDIDGNHVAIIGDQHETLFYYADDQNRMMNRLATLNIKAHPPEKVSNTAPFVQVSSHEAMAPDLVKEILGHPGVIDIKMLPPVLPILRTRNSTLPFRSCAEMLHYCKDRTLSLADLALVYESHRGNISKKQVLDQMTGLFRIVRQSIQGGLKGTTYADRILGCQSRKFSEKLSSGQLLDAGVFNRIIHYITVMMEVKSAMGVILAAPTAGACGCLPASVMAASESLGRNEKEAAQAMLAGGMIGVFIAAFSTFAAEVGGCQAECGAASGMAAAALATLMGGKAKQAVAAASMALQNSFGMTCDPVAGRVEVPCLGKNIMAAGNALSCANMALAGFDPVIPLDEVIHAMDRVGKSLPRELRCTALGGLSATETSRKIEKGLS
jgi:L-serine dehydratase